MSVFLERKSIRNYDVNHKIDDKVFTEMLEIAFRAPSSLNMQPTRVFVIKDEQAKAKLKPALLGNDLQVTTSSHVLAIFTDLEKYKNVHKIFNTAFELGIIPDAVRKAQIERITKISETVTSKKVVEDGIFDAGLFVMQFMLVARSFGYDTCPIGGFNRELINGALGIDSRYYPVLLLSVGKRNEDGYKSYRLDLKDTVTYL